MLSLQDCLLRLLTFEGWFVVSEVRITLLDQLMEGLGGVAKITSSYSTAAPVRFGDRTRQRH
jgi:hypothetical protein